MAATLDALYRSERFLQLDHLSLIAELIEPEYHDKVSKRVNNRLHHAGLLGRPEVLADCTDSSARKYLPNGITSVLASLAFVDDGLNICILGPSDSGKTYLAKALGIAVYQKYKVEYHHCEAFLEDIAVLKLRDCQSN